MTRWPAFVPTEEQSLERVGLARGRPALQQQSRRASSADCSDPRAELGSLSPIRRPSSVSSPRPELPNLRGVFRPPSAAAQASQIAVCSNPRRSNSPRRSSSPRRSISPRRSSSSRRRSTSPRREGFCSPQESGSQWSDDSLHSVSPPQCSSPRRSSPAGPALSIHPPAMGSSSSFSDAAASCSSLCDVVAVAEARECSERLSEQLRRETAHRVLAAKEAQERGVALAAARAEAEGLAEKLAARDALHAEQLAAEQERTRQTETKLRDKGTVLASCQRARSKERSLRVRVEGRCAVPLHSFSPAASTLPPCLPHLSAG